VSFGHVIAEACVQVYPILIADTTPWRNFAKNGIGWDFH